VVPERLHDHNSTIVCSQRQVPARDTAPNVSDLLFARTMYFLHVMEILFYGRTVGKQFN